MVDALVTDGQSRAAVAGVRALGHAGLRALAAGPSRGAPALWSRHATVRALCPPPGDSGFVDRIAELARAHGPLVVHPAQEEAIDPLIAAAASLPAEAVVPYPGAAPLARLRDKAGLGGLAAAAGLIAPATLFAGRAGGLVAADLPVPCVVKSTGLSAALPVARMVEARAELETLLTGLPADEPVVVQEKLEGPLVAVSLVLDRDGRTVARLQQIAHRLWPVRGGASAFAVTVEPEPDLLERARAVLAGAGYWGLAQLQFVRTARGHALIDVNPRYYGSLPLALAAGVNLPAAWHQVALGRTPPEPASYRVGVSYRWLEGDVRAAMQGDRGRLRPSRPRAASGAMWAGGDPVPSALMAAQTAWEPFGRRLGGVFRLSRG